MATCTTPFIEAMVKTYVVFIGRKHVIYEKWSEANVEVNSYPGACFKGYDTRKEADEAFDSFLKKASDDPTCSQPNCSTSNSSVNGTNQSKPHNKLGHLIKAVADLVLQNRNLANTVEKNSEDIGILLEKMKMIEDG